MSKKHINQLFGQQDGICHYCDEQTFLNTPFVNHPRRATKEHIVPKSLGGQDTMKNYVMVCNECNSKRGIALLYCRCTRCSRLIHSALTKPEFIDRILNRMMKESRPRIKRARLGKWLVIVDTKAKVFETWQQAVDYVNIVVLDTLEKVG